MSLKRRKLAPGTRRRARGAGWRRSRLAAFVVAFALIVQLFAATTQPSPAAPAFAGADEATVAAGLKALFGDAAKLCVQIGGKVPAKHTPCGNCCDQCPLCRFAAQAAAFVPPDLPAFPERLDSDALAIRAPPGQDGLPAYPAQPNPARAPPLAV